MTTAMTMYPIADLAKLSKEDIEAYATVVYKVASADGSLSSNEASALENAFKSQFQGKVTMDRVKQLSSKSLKDLLQHDEALKVLGPYVIRDAARVADADGELSQKEVAAILEASKDLGISSKRTESIISSVKHHREMVLAWSAGLNG